MPRPRRPGAPEPKRRSRKGCWPCKARKVKCGEEKPSCLNCQRQNEPCDYSIRLNWGGRTRRKLSIDSPSSQSSRHSGHSSSFTLSPPALPQALLAGPVPSLKATNGLEDITTEDHSAEVLFWDAEFAGEMNIGTSYPRRLHDIQDSPTVPDQSLNILNRTTDRDSVDMGHLSQAHQTASPWSDLPGRMANSPGEEISNFPPLASNSLDSAPFHSQTAASPNFLALPSFNFLPGAVSQPISFVRPAVGHSMHRSPFEHGNIPDYRNNALKYSSSVDIGVVSVSADSDSMSPSTSHGTLSPRSNDAHLFSSGILRDHEGSPDSVFTGIIEGSTALDNGYRRETSAISDSPYTQAQDLRAALNDYSAISSSEKKWQTYLTSVTDNYGLDCGRPDKDLGKNDDHSAIDVNDALGMIQLRTESRFGKQRVEVEPSGVDSSKYDYYTSAVPINIPRYLSPLPPSLVKTPINLMYFHHFLNHTARILVPHDCVDNPFSSVLPSMAIGDSNLLNLMLAYSASHRARHLGHPEPANRIAHWVSNVFPSLRIALEDPREKVTDNHLATAIMLLSLKIVSPSTFEVPIPWQSHLKLARDLFLARQSQMAYPRNRIGAFLTRWLGYLDIVGSLSCRHHEPPLLDYYSLLNTCGADQERDEFAIDCFTGFSPRTGLFLMRLGGLVHQCDNERFDDMGTFILEWAPSSNVITEAEALITDWDSLDTHVYSHKKHHEGSDECFDMIAIDRAFRYAGLLHLLRRVLGEPPTSATVTKALNGLIEAVTSIRPGADVEVGALFPIFTAGCEVQDLERRLELSERLEVLEGTGMKQIQNARTLMQRCWDTNLPWIALAQGEFLG